MLKFNQPGIKIQQQQLIARDGYYLLKKDFGFTQKISLKYALIKCDPIR